MKIKMVKNYLVIFVALLALSSLVSAVSFSGIKDVYNLGDTLNFDVNVKKNQSLGGILEVDLICNEDAELIFKQFVFTGTVNILQPLEEKFLDNIPGVGCRISANYESESGESKTFSVSDKIDLDLKIIKDKLDPEEELEFIGNAVKQNSNEAAGNFQAYIEDTDLSVNGSFRNGSFSDVIVLPFDMRAGDYVFYVNVFEKNVEGKVSNNGHQSRSIKINQKPTNLDVVLEKQEFVPGSEINFQVLLKDQTDDRISNEEIYVTVSEPKDKSEEKHIDVKIDSGESVKFQTSSNDTFGYWRILAQYPKNNLTKERIFYLQELEKADFEIEDGYLIISNEGNVPYDQKIEIKIGGKVERREVELELGEIKKFKLSAPNGNYDILVNDNLTNFTEQGVLLTGRTISVRSSQSHSLVKNLYFVLFFLILAFGIFLFGYLNRKKIIEFVEKQKFFRKNKKMPKTDLKPQLQPRHTTDKKTGLLIAPTVISSKGLVAEQTLVKDGQKQNVSMIALKIKNYKELKQLKSNAIENITKAMEIATENKGSIYETEDSIIAIFTPEVTRTFKNEQLATKTSFKILKKLREHNQKFVHKIDFGIGVDSGHLIVKKTPHKLEFTNIGHTLPLARKISNLADKDVLLSKTIHEKIMPEIKSNKVIHIKDLDVYKIKSIVDRSQHEKFLKEFMSRNN